MAADKQTTAGNAGKRVNRATEDAHDTIDRASSAVHPAVDNLASSAHRTVDRMAGVASSTAENLDARAEQFLEAQTQFVDQVRDYVREHPVASVGIAVAGGFLLSRLLASR
jgi:ElaB/YqjD/DUF883 family membrane-anchored ribosome-binding protein